MNPIKFFSRLKLLETSPLPRQSTIGTNPEFLAAANILRTAKKVAVLTGAGMSAESGIATFRAKVGGIWQQFDATEVATPLVLLSCWVISLK